MKAFLKFLQLSILILIQTFSVQAQNNEPVELNISYIGDMANNLSGGIKPGSQYLGLAQLQFSFNSQNAGWWNGGLFHVVASNTHGENSSNKLYGDFQVASNIAAGNHTYFEELWFSQSFSKFICKTCISIYNKPFHNWCDTL